MKEFRQLTVEDTAEYHKVLIDGYAAIKDFPITFDAIDFTEEESKEWIENYPVYGLYIDGQLVSSITFCMPWVKFKTPAVTLGTAKEHPWLPKMYESFGFKAYDQVHFRGKQHTTVLFKKDLI